MTPAKTHLQSHGELPVLYILPWHDSITEEKPGYL